MPTDISDLQRQFIDFAEGMPAVAISWAVLEYDINELQKTLAGTMPDAPSPAMADIFMPTYGLAYSAFLNGLTVRRAGSRAELYVDLIANVHPQGRISDVIRSYKIETIRPAIVTLDIDDAANEIFWQAQGTAQPDIAPSWAPNADGVLATTTIPDPQRDTYLEEVERSILWLTAPSFIKLVTDALPRYSLTEILPWLKFTPPIRTSFGPDHVLVTSSRAKLTVGDCNPQTIDIEPDPNFPYGESIPAPTLSANRVDVAVYSPRTRILDFVAKKIEPAVLVHESGGGVIKWNMTGAVGLKRITVDIATGQGLSGVISVNTDIDFVGAARAWIDGPSGVKLSLASASVIGSGSFGADVVVRVVLPDGYVEAILKVTKATLTADFDVHTPLGWPIDAVASEILNRVSKNEVQKLVRHVSKLGHWDFLGLPLTYAQSFGPYEVPEGHVEGLARVSAFVGVTRRDIG